MNTVVAFQGLGKYRIVQRGVHAFMIQRRIFMVWTDMLETNVYSQDRCHEILNGWAEDAKVYGRVIWP